MIWLLIFFAVASILLVLVPVLVFVGSCAVWKIRGSDNPVEWSLYDGVVAFVLTATAVLTVAPFALSQGTSDLTLFSILPPLIAAVGFRHLANPRARMRNVVAYFLVLREAKESAARRPAEAGAL